MEINIGNNFIAGRQISGAGAADTAGTVKEAANAPKQAANLTIGASNAAIVSPEPVLDIPDSALARTDRLGKLVDVAFNLPPPPMPEFL